MSIETADVGAVGGGETGMPDVSNTSNATPDTSANGDVGGGDSVGILGVDPDDDFVKDAMKNNPNFFKPSKTAEDNKDVVGETKEADAPTEDVTDNNDVDVNANDGAVEYQDDIIPGLKGSDFAALSDEAKLAIVEYAEKNSAELDAANKQLETLLSDPLIKQRQALINDGVADIPVRAMTKEEKNAFIDKCIDDLVLAEEDAIRVAALVEEHTDAIAQRMAQDYVSDIMTYETERQSVDNLNKQGNDLILSLGELNPALAVKETNLDNFYELSADGKSLVYNDKHPEIEKFKNGLAKVISASDEMGIKYSQALAMGKEAFYSAIAAKLKLPVALNTAERDKKIVADALNKKLGAFLKPNGKKTLSVSQGSASEHVYKEISVGGFDAIKAATDSKYYDLMAQKYFDDVEKLDALFNAAQVGRNIISQSKKTA